MAGIGITLNKIFSKNTMVANLVGLAYSTVSTIAPMLVVIITLYLCGYVLDTSSVNYASRQLFSTTVLYIFIFSLTSAAPFNAVLSRYMSDIIYEEKYDNIMSCFYVGLLLNVLLACAMSIPFCIREYIVGKVDPIYVFTGFVTFIALVLVYYTMLYLSICKEFTKISAFFAVGMLITFLLSMLFAWVFNIDKMYSILLALAIGFIFIACAEFALIYCYFPKNSKQYKTVFVYFQKYWQLVVANLCYTIGMYVHNFVFWHSNLQMKVADSFICAQSYDLATCMALFTNISASIIFISRIEMHFHEIYKEYSESVLGREWDAIVNAKKRMFRRVSGELVNLVRIQFIISVILYLLFIIFLPRFGFSGLAMDIYPSLAAGFFILFVMYAELLFLYYFNDLTGSLITSVLFLTVTLLSSIICLRLSPIWYGMGLFCGAFCGWTYAYFRLRWVEKNLDEHVFCRGQLLKKRKGKRPSSCVYKA